VCDVHAHGAGGLAPLEHDEYVVDTPAVRAFVGAVRAAIDGAETAAEAIAAVEPSFAGLLGASGWLPEGFERDAPASGMGGGIGQWLLFRSADRSLCLFSLVVPPGARTPIHDHGAWGLVGLYRGRQDEELYRPAADGVELTRRRPLEPGDWYALLPPESDVHRVTTTSAETSVSIHLLANDTGCVLRHVYDEETGRSRPFRSGYVNVACPEGEPVVGS
jgi:3-mercaptopropionate dioxygenase